MSFVLSFDDFVNENNSEVAKLKKELKATDDWFSNNSGKNYQEDKWEQKNAEAVDIRRKLFALTGDYYGETKKKIDKKPNSTLLSAEYDHPSELPKNVFDYITKNGNLLFDDASDAVRWTRIINTEKDGRYPSGEMTIYRATEKGNYDNIRPGDWVTTDEKYAAEHNRRWFDDMGQIISMDVDGRDVLVSPTGNYEEAIYAPMELSKPLKYWNKK